jgi:hypothetical protein
VSASLVEVDLDDPELRTDVDEAGADGPVQAVRFTFEVESGTLLGRLGARATVAPNDDGSVTVNGSTEFRAADFDVHLPGLGHLRGVCHWTVVVVPRG